MYAPTQTVTLTAEFLSGPGGSLVDATDLTIMITDPTGAVEVAASSAGIVHVTTGVYKFAWTIPADAFGGDHLVLWSGDSGTATATDIVTVSSVQATWCSVDDVALYTGIVVSDALLAQASAVLELHIARTYDELVANPDGGSIKIGRRDKQWLRQACAYQAAWMTAQPDMFQRLDMLAMASTGRPITLRDRALVLAPLARKAIARVSWLRSRSIHVRTPFTDGIGPVSPNMAAESNDAYEGPWIPLGAD